MHAPAPMARLALVAIAAGLSGSLNRADQVSPEALRDADELARVLMPRYLGDGGLPSRAASG